MHPPSTSLSGADLIAVERLRQLEAEGWTAEHDDAHDSGELCGAAMAYIANRDSASVDPEPPSWWPWESSWWKPSDDPIRNLVKAGALLAAEIDRLQRLRVVHVLPDACPTCGARWSCAHEGSE